jgi:hypothetical protein
MPETELPQVLNLDDARRWIGILRMQLARERRRNDLAELRLAELERPWWLRRRVGRARP